MEQAILKLLMEKEKSLKYKYGTEDKIVSKNNTVIIGYCKGPNEKVKSGEMERVHKGT